ncbi:hypothetical protein DM02DRAFT_658876 [Periconia macrospinosa]|uniref:Uncharacterized protein n=1 Tax=Periconia macrospinosa TaxID=97972 RepID=A0A2V1DFI1_9PLEO|nr:hypothetical protein DM02DRAFT_658876 [Periconia macrospinosa]
MPYVPLPTDVDQVHGDLKEFCEEFLRKQSAYLCSKSFTFVLERTTLVCIDPGNRTGLLGKLCRSNEGSQGAPSDNKATANGITANGNTATAPSAAASNSEETSGANDTPVIANTPSPENDSPFSCEFTFSQWPGDMLYHLAQTGMFGAARWWIDDEHYLLFTFVCCDEKGFEAYTFYEGLLENGASWPDIMRFIHQGEDQQFLDYNRVFPVE